MLASSAKFRPAIAWFGRQIAPSVLATLLAALVIAGYNRAFSGHLQQPRMAALHAATDAKPAPASVAADVPAADAPPAWLAKVVEITGLAAEQEQIWDKDEGREAAKDQGRIKVVDVAPTATAPTAVAPAPVAPRPAAARQEPRQEFRPEPRAVEQRPSEPRPFEPRVVGIDPRGAGPMPAPVVQPMPQPVIVQQPAMAPVAVTPGPMMVPAAQPPVVAGPVSQEPPPVITAKPMVTVPDRPGQRPAYEAPAREQASEQQQGVLGAIVNTLKPSSIFKSAREFGDRIEAAGNDILPNIRQ